MPVKCLLPLLLLLTLFTANVAAQQATGVTYRKISNTRMGNVLVTNLNNHEIRMSDEAGNFMIKASAGDSLEFSKTDYTPQRQAYNGYAMVVYMQPELKLGEVRVVGQTKRQELAEVMGSYRKQGTFYNGKPPALSFLTNPITGVYELFGKTPNRAKHFAQFAKKELELSEVDRRYNRTIVKRVTGMTDSTEVQRFMEYWKPSYEDLKIWAEYDLMKHIQSNYTYFKKNGNRAPELPKINAPASLGGPGPIKIKKP
ncbi:hypothetical protein DYU05_18160 [Mucilaginibacter terrenus]|uniref:Carboxypeptidase-like regulatory domain-containing protein n=1 Tax=Mucilaginibacter terrenus TaxID=2482727 RepID=A0A3E2NL76_9SPHI|nr:hypothetical protein [Mucilaginibacter terrenus]RFZ81746.1 hypothetical protein DYU05_18160 [Mucilaginibacter terrenus]